MESTEQRVAGAAGSTARGPFAGKVCVVTGATSGLGRAIAERLAALGGTVVLVARDADRAEAARREIAASTGNDRLDVVLADLSSQASIRAGARTLLERHPRVDVLMNQAGLVESERRVTVDGVETMFAVNHLAYFMLTNLLADALARGEPGVVMNSAGGIEAAGEIDFDDLQLEKKFSWFRGLSQSKLANMLFTYEAARRLGARGVKVHCLNPGGVKTNLGKNARGLPRVFMSIGRLFFASPESAAKKIVGILASPEVRTSTGGYFGPNGRPAKSSPRSHDEAMARKLWDASAALTGMAS